MIDIEKAIELFKHHDKAKFTLTGLGEREYNTKEFEDVIHCLEKQLPQKADMGFDTSINMGEDPNDSIYLECPNCKACVGEICDEDADGNLKYNVFEKYCSSCGQLIEQTYTKEDYTRWGIPTE